MSGGVDGEGYFLIGLIKARFEVAKATYILRIRLNNKVRKCLRILIVRDALSCVKSSR